MGERSYFHYTGNNSPEHLFLERERSCLLYSFFIFLIFYRFFKFLIFFNPFHPFFFVYPRVRLRFFWQLFLKS